MIDEEQYQEVLTRAFRRMHVHTCAEAALAALAELWDLPEPSPWAAAGYMGAIETGQALCGVVFGTISAIGLRTRGSSAGLPEENGRVRRKAIRLVRRFVRAFTDHCGACACREVSGVDFRDPVDARRYLDEQVWKSTCDPALKFALDWCRAQTEAGKI